jgi:steroid delta-isomerase-like uncharacterized protein
MADRVELSPSRVTTLLERALRAAERGDIDGALPYFADDCEIMDMGDVSSALRGRAGIRQYLEEFYSTMTDLSLELNNIVVQGDRAVVEMVITARHVGELAGVQATNRRFSFHACVCYGIRDGMIAEERVYYDMSEVERALTAPASV